MFLNTFLSEFINGLSGNIELIDNMMILISKITPYFLMGCTILYYILGMLNKEKELRVISAHAVIKTFIAFVISQGIGKLFPIDRPFIANNNVKELYPHEINSSFPSDHSLGCMGLAMGLNKYKNKYNSIFMFLAIMTGVSRVYVGHHYPLDVIGGFLLAKIVAVLYDKYLINKISNIYFLAEEMIASLAFNIFKIKKTQ